MSDTLKLEYKVGAIEFKAEGPADVVEQQRVNFMNTVLPAAVEAMVRTQAAPAQSNYIEAAPQAPMLEAGVETKQETAVCSPETDFSRTSLSAFIKKYGPLTEQDFTLFSAYFDEMKNGTKAFCIDDVKRYYSEARRSMPKNPSMSLYKLAEKGFIMDTQAPEDAKAGKFYTLTNEGLDYINCYSPKEDNGEKKTRTKARKQASKASSTFATINADDLNLKQYPTVKTFDGTKDKVLLAMFIVTQESQFEWFTAEDVSYILENIFETSVSAKSVNGVFDRNKSIFACEQDPNNKKAVRRKLLSSAKDYAKSIIEG